MQNLPELPCGHFTPKIPHLHNISFLATWIPHWQQKAGKRMQSALGCPGERDIKHATGKKETDANPAAFFQLFMKTSFLKILSACV